MIYMLVVGQRQNRRVRFPSPFLEAEKERTIVLLG
jgi:hypothetical protein